MSEPVFVGRERELMQLQTFLDRALAGQGMVCFVTGEAGAGKTALIHEFIRRGQEAHEHVVAAFGSCNAYTGIGDPYLPFREILGLLTGDMDAKLRQGAISPKNVSRLTTLLAQSLDVLVEVGPDLVDVMVPGAKLLATLTKAVVRKVGMTERLETLTKRKAAILPTVALAQNALFEQYTNVLQALAAQQPLLLVVDDLQWADVASINLLFHLSRRIAQSRILCVGAYRPDEIALGRNGERHPLEPVLNDIKRYAGDVAIDLHQAMAAEGRAFVDALLDAEPNALDEAFRAALYQLTEGHALFTVELLREMQERGDLVRDEQGRWVASAHLDWTHLPARVEGILAERIGRLKDELRQILSAASVEGENFTAQVITRVQELQERHVLDALSQELERLHRLVEELGEVQVNGRLLSRFRFAHSLFQQFLYDQLGAASRRLLHSQVAHVLEELYSGRSEEVAVQLARHFQEAREVEKAIQYLFVAGNRARQLGAGQEAAGHFTQAIALLQTLPASPARDQQELPLQFALGLTQLQLRLLVAPDVLPTLERARTLAEQGTDPLVLYSTLWALYNWHLIRGNFDAALAVSEQALPLVESMQSPALLIETHLGFASVYMFRGQAAAQEHLEKMVPLYQMVNRQVLIDLYGFDRATMDRSYECIYLCYLGYPDQALRRIDEIHQAVVELGHPYPQAVALFIKTSIHLQRGEWQAVLEHAEACMAVCTKYGLIYWLGWAHVMGGYALAFQGQTAAGIQQIRDGMDMHREIGVRLHRSIELHHLAEVYLTSGQLQEGMNALEEGLAEATTIGETWWLAHLYRLKGDLLLAQSAANQADAAAWFQRAIAMAQEHHARCFELAATTSLARLLHRQAKSAEAYAMLATIYNWFTEGFDTRALREAKAILDELNAQVWHGH